MNSTTLSISNNWSVFSLRAALATIINQLQSLTKFPEYANLTTNIWHSTKSPAKDRPKDRRDGGSRGNTSEQTISSPESPNETPNFHALLIGIDFYFPHKLEGGSYRNLRGCVRDINHVENYLKNTFNLSPDQIIKLTATASDNPEKPQESPELLPTYQNIVAKFKELTAKAKPQDQVYIHYSGHGGRAKTIFPNIKGIYGLDEGLVPTDIGQENSQYLRDLELAKLLQEMVNKELVVTLVLDSCHSGGAVRDKEDDRVRAGGFIDMTSRPTDSLVTSLQQLEENWNKSTENNRNITVTNGLLPEPQGYTLIAACRDHESAFEDIFEGTERNGALTYFMLKALQEFGTEISSQDLFNRIYNFVHNRFEQQTPMLIGETNRTFFGGQSVVSSPTPTVMDVDVAKNRVKIQVGQANGFKKGAEFDIFKFRTKDFEDSQNKVATVKIVELGASDSWAEVTQLHNIRTINNDLEEGMIEIGSSAVELSPGVKQIRKVALILPEQLPEIPGVNVAFLPNILADKKKQVEGHRWIEFCSETDKDVDYFVSLNAAGEYWVLDAEKEPIKNIIFPIKAGEPDASQKLINRLIHLAKYQSILDLDNEDVFAPLNGKIKVELVKSEKRELIVLNTGDNIPVLKEDEENLYLIISNESNRTLNITILMLDADLMIQKLFPKGAPSDPLEPEKNIQRKLPLCLPKNYQEGEIIIKVFATLDSTNFELLQLPALDQSRKGFGNQEPTNILERLCAKLVDENNPKRRIRAVSYANEEWTTEKVEVLIRK